MTAPERDEVVAQALRDLPVPPADPSFWADLEARLAEAAVGGDGGRPDTGELPTVAAHGARRSNRRTPILVAAAVLVLVGAVGFVALGGDDDGADTEVAEQPEVTGSSSTDDGTEDAAATTASAPGGGTATTAAAGDADDAEAVVTSWLDALGSGDVAAAAELTGPRTAAYVESLGPDASLEGLLTESEESYGAWAGAEDREVAVLPVEPVEVGGGTLRVVVVSGTSPGEGSPHPQVDVFPVIDDGDGFRVEHLAFGPDRDNDPTFTLPDETETGLGAMAPGDAVNVFVPAAGTVYFQVDGGEVATVATTELPSGTFARFDPAGELAAGEHVLVLVAVGDDGTVTAFGGPFTVEP